MTIWLDRILPSDMIYLKLREIAATTSIAIRSPTRFSRAPTWATFNERAERARSGDGDFLTAKNHRRYVSACRYNLTSIPLGMHVCTYIPEFSPGFFL